MMPAEATGDAATAGTRNRGAPPGWSQQISWNSRPAGTLATLTADCEFVDGTLGLRWSGHDGAAAHYTMWWNAFDLRVIGERLHLAAESAVAETTWKGTHVGTFAGVAATEVDVAQAARGISLRLVVEVSRTHEARGDRSEVHALVDAAFAGQLQGGLRTQ